MTRTYVTGANGFIGGKLWEKLLIQGSSPLAISYKDIQHRNTVPNSQVFFLSTYGNMSSHSDCHEMMRSNIVDLIRVVNWNPRFLLFTSSSSVTLPVQTPYSRTKRAAEEILQALPELKSCIVRPYSVTGVGEQKEHLIPTLIRSCMTGEEMPFDPNPVHDFVDVEDIVDALIYCADNQITGIVELGSGMPKTNQEIKEYVEDLCLKKANTVEVKSLRPYDNAEWYSRKHYPWWKPKKTVWTSIQEMVEAYA